MEAGELSSIAAPNRAKPRPLDPAEERALYLRGIELFNAQSYFDAHEAWEDAWRPMRPGIKREFYQGLIQCAVALEHYARSNPHGVVTLYDSYRKRMRDVPDLFMGLDVKTFLAQMHESLRPVLECDPLPGKGQIQLDRTRVPRISLQTDPFVTGEAARWDADARP